MRVRVFFSVAEVEAAELHGKTVVVIDVLRATSTIVAALASGARAIYPVASPDEAVRLGATLGREDTLLCGERRGLKIEGFHLGNSPGEFTAERVSGRRLVMSTTNGTRAFQAAAPASRILVGSLLNLGAAARAAASAEALVILCAGREDNFALDDAVCAGLLLERLEVLLEAPPKLDDAGRASRLLAQSVEPDADFLRSVAGGEALVSIGLDEDVDHCARIDLHDIVPVMQERMIRLAGGS
jgi:2-phosphosulfolactate phosphatase